MSIQKMPYPPHVKIDTTDLVLREVICTFTVISFLIPLCIEANYASKEKFIGVNVSSVIFFYVLSYLCSIIYSNHCAICRF
jgi:hypothetical protein